MVFQGPKQACVLHLNNAQKVSFPLTIYLVNVTKISVSSGFGHI